MYGLREGGTVVIFKGRYASIVQFELLGIEAATQITVREVGRRRRPHISFVTVRYFRIWENESFGQI